MKLSGPETKLSSYMDSLTINQSVIYYLHALKQLQLKHKSGDIMGLAEFN